MAAKAPYPFLTAFPDHARKNRLKAALLRQGAQEDDALSLALALHYPGYAGWLACRAAHRRRAADGLDGGKL